MSKILRCILYPFLYLFILSAYSTEQEVSPPSWFDKNELCHGCIIVYGSGPVSQTELEAINLAKVNAYQTLATQEFGMGIELRTEQMINNTGTSIHEQTTGYAQIYSLPSTILSKEVKTLTDRNYIGFVKIKFLLKDIAKQKEQNKKFAETAFSNKLKAITSAQRIGKNAELAGELIIKGIPDGSEIFLDSELVAKSDVTFPNVGAGEYLLAITNIKYHSAQSRLTIEPGKKIIIEVNLEPKMGDIVINTEPQNAAIAINGTFVGRSPINKSLPPGNYQLRIEKDGFQKRDLFAVSSTDKKITYRVTLYPDRRR